jgi:hypothetical protein
LPKPVKQKKKTLLQSLASTGRVELLIAVLFLAAVVTGITVFADGLLTPVALHDNGAKFATAVRDAQQVARDKGTPLLILVLPARPGIASSYAVYEGNTKLREGTFSKGITAVGKITLDSQGVPGVRTQISLHKGMSHREVIVDANGTVTMP